MTEESWEEANYSAASYTPHSSRRIRFYAPQESSIDIQCVDTSTMTLLDVCNYTVEEEEVDGSGHCVWMGALFFVHAVSVGMMVAKIDCDSPAQGETVTSSSSWYSDSYFHNQTVAEMGCGTGAAGIALLKILLSQGSSLTTQPISPKRVTFLDNDPDALELCRKNCQQNGISKSVHDIQLQEPWADLSCSSEDKPSKENFCFDTILATDVLYDLKIIRPFLQTASRFLRGPKPSDDSIPHKKHLILSHVPRWFLPSNDKDNSDPYDASKALEKHIVKEATQLGFQLIHTVRPKDIVRQWEYLTQQETTSSSSRGELIEELQEMQEANAVLWVLELQAHTQPAS